MCTEPWLNFNYVITSILRVRIYLGCAEFNLFITIYYGKLSEISKIQTATAILEVPVYEKTVIKLALSASIMI